MLYTNHSLSFSSLHVENVPEKIFYVLFSHFSALEVVRLSYEQIGINITIMKT